MKALRHAVLSILVPLATAYMPTASASTSGIVISQVYGGGGNSSALYTHDFIELFNAGSTPVDISGWSVQYASQGGSSWSNMTAIPAGTSLNPGQYFLIQQAQGAGGTTPLPDPDLTGTINLAAGGGKVALVNNSTALSGACPSGGSIVDFVGFGTAASCYEGSAPAPMPGNATAGLRSDAGCTDTDDNGADFVTDDPTPRNTASPAHVCSGNSGINASIAAVELPEGDAGTTAFEFVLSLSAPAPVGGVTFDIATSDGSAIAPSDYAANSITGATIAEGDSDYTFTVLVNGDTTVEPDESFTVTASNFSGSDVIATTVSATGVIRNDDIGDFAIYTIQGSPSTQGADGASPYAGQRVRTSGIVTVVPGGGFYLQDADGDGDPLTSDGIYVFDNAASVSVGDKVSLEANVSEYYGLTELSGVGNLVIESSGNPLPAPVVFDAETPSRDPANLSCGDTNFECFEGMLVQIDDGIVTQPSGYSSAHTYDYVYVSAGGTRSLREPGLLYGLGGAPVDNPADNGAAGEWDGNPEVFEMSPNEFPGVNDDSVAITGGSRFNATGVISYSFGSYEFYPSALQITEAAPVPRATPSADPAILTIGSFNVERYCDDIDDRQPPGIALAECAGNAVPTTAQYEAKTQRLADYIGTVLNLPDVVALEEVENITVLSKLAARIKDDYGIDYTPLLLEGNDISGIDIGYLVNTDRVTLSSPPVQQLDKDLKWLTPNNNERPVFDHPPLLLQGIFTGGGQNQPFMVLANHLKARTDVDKVTSTGNSTVAAKEAQEKRFRQAYALAMQVQALQSGEPPALRGSSVVPMPASNTDASVPLVVVGDFNAWEFTDGFADLIGMVSGRYDFDANTWDLSDLVEWNLEPLSTPLMDANVVSPALWNAVQSLPENERYSYLFTPSFGAVQGYGIGGGARKVPTNQSLDHALLNTGARALFARMDFGRANQDAASEDIHDSTGPIGVSDHDGFVVQLTLDRIFADGFENDD